MTPDGPHRTEKIVVSLARPQVRLAQFPDLGGGCGAWGCGVSTGPVEAEWPEWSRGTPYDDLLSRDTGRPDLTRDAPTGVVRSGAGPRDRGVSGEACVAPEARGGTLGYSALPDSTPWGS